MISRLLWEKKAQDILIIDLAGRTLLTDVLVLSTATSRIHVRAVTAELLSELKSAKVPILNLEGYEEGLWVVVDLGAVMVHVFEPDMREFYRLDRLWPDATHRTYSGPPE